MHNVLSLSLYSENCFFANFCLISKGSPVKENILYNLITLLLKMTLTTRQSINKKKSKREISGAHNVNIDQEF